MIKFRAFDKKHKQMVKVISLNWYDEITDYNVVGLFPNTESVARFWDEIIVMQSTGLKDKDGVEIYEGDIVKITNTERFCGKNYTCYSAVEKINGHIYVWPHPVVDGETKRFGAKLLFSGIAKYIKDNGVATEDVEVLGNIYENSELLEVTE